VPTQRQPRARAVADAPVQALLDRAEQLARSWALALIAARPLGEIAQLPLAELTRAAPELCAALARALASDDELEQLAGVEGVVPPSAPLTGPPGAVVADVDLLRSIVWEATLAELRDPPPRLLADLADRLSYACSVVLATTLQAGGAGDSRPLQRSTPQPQADERAARVAREHRVPTGGGAVLVDEAGHEPRPLASLGELEQTRPLADERAPAPREPPGAPDAASKGSGAEQRRPGGGGGRGASAPDVQPQRPAPRARPWDTPLGDEPTLRVRRGTDARADDRGEPRTS
jgi:hypothetical protein